MLPNHTKKGRVSGDTDPALYGYHVLPNTYTGYVRDGSPEKIHAPACGRWACII